MRFTVRGRPSVNKREHGSPRTPRSPTLFAKYAHCITFSVTCSDSARRFLNPNVHPGQCQKTEHDTGSAAILLIAYKMTYADAFPRRMFGHTLKALVTLCTVLHAPGRDGAACETFYYQGWQVKRNPATNGWECSTTSVTDAAFRYRSSFQGHFDVRHDETVSFSILILGISGETS